ncbi:hypothetical protein [Caballeronia sp. 15711]|uniref:hypothetical protein n=1 Tax=Caballeronia sp. 15711 TaxID=3391029 RepID=UPI0039E4F34A
MVSAFQISLSAGATLGGLLVDHMGVAATFVFSGVVSVAGAACALAYRAEPTSTHPSKATLGDAK